MGVWRVKDPEGTMPVSLQNNLSELDTLLADLNSAKYSGDTAGADTTTRSIVSNSYAYGDYYSDYDSSVGDQKAPERPPPPNTYQRPEPIKSMITLHYPSHLYLLVKRSWKRRLELDPEGKGVWL